jgi:co-chaperonin GroES (HSP10)
MTPFEDYITFTIEKRYEDKSKSGIITINEAWIDPEESDRFVLKRIFGTVVSIPKSFSDTKVTAIDPGLPTPKAFVGHEWINDKVNRGYKNHSNKDYYPSTFEGYEFITLKDISKLCDIQIGDVVYFDEKVTEPENLLGVKDGKELFKARIDEIFCAVRNNVIIMQGGWVLVEPDMETWDDITTKSGIITKIKPEATPLKGAIRHVREPHPFMRKDQNIIYKTDADWTLKVQGKEYYVIQENDILGEL